MGQKWALVGYLEFCQQTKMMGIIPGYGCIIKTSIKKIYTVSDQWIWTDRLTDQVDSNIPLWWGLIKQTPGKPRVIMTKYIQYIFNTDWRDRAGIILYIYNFMYIEF